MFSKFTQREQQVVELVAAGKRNSEIARRLGMTEGVVKNYNKAIFDKVGCDSRLQLAMLYRERMPPGLFPPIPRCAKCISMADPCFWCILCCR